MKILNILIITSSRDGAARHDIVNSDLSNASLEVKQAITDLLQKWNPETACYGQNVEDTTEYKDGNGQTVITLMHGCELVDHAQIISSEIESGKIQTVDLPCQVDRFVYVYAD